MLKLKEIPKQLHTLKLKPEPSLSKKKIKLIYEIYK